MWYMPWAELETAIMGVSRRIDDALIDEIHAFPWREEAQQLLEELDNV